MKKANSMKALTFFVIFSIPLKMFSQDLKLSGKVEYYDIKDTGRIFYTEPGKDFDRKNFILYDKMKGYNFKMSIARIKKEKITTLVFSIDPGQRSNDVNACTQRINVGNIVNSPEFSNLKTIKLTTDLLLDINCESTVYYDAKMEGKDRFAGSYLLEVSDTVHTLRLENVLFQYTSVLSKRTADFMSEETGSWAFNSENKTLTFYISYQSNKAFGLILRNGRQLEFNVVETEGRLSFSSGAGLLKKI